MQKISGGTQATYVRLDEDHREILQQIAEAEGTTISALLRRAAIQVFSLPTGSQKMAMERGTLAHINRERPDAASVTGRAKGNTL